MEYGILIVSHVPEIAQGLPQLLKQVAKDVSITYAGGTEDNEIGTSINKITEALDENKADKIWAFYDLGSARMNLEMAEEMSDKQITIHDTALIESAYVAASLLQVNTPIDAIEKQLADLKVKGD